VDVADLFLGVGVILHLFGSAPCSLQLQVGRAYSIGILILIFVDLQPLAELVFQFVGVPGKRLHLAGRCKLRGLVGPEGSCTCPQDGPQPDSAFSCWVSAATFLWIDAAYSPYEDWKLTIRPIWCSGRTIPDPMDMIIFSIRQKNLWVSGGSGSLPSEWYKAISVILNVRKP